MTNGELTELVETDREQITEELSDRIIIKCKGSGKWCFSKADCTIGNMLHIRIGDFVQIMIESYGAIEGPAYLEKSKKWDIPMECDKAYKWIMKNDQNRVSFKTRIEAQVALDWIESCLVMRRLSNNELRSENE